MTMGSSSTRPTLGQHVIVNCEQDGSPCEMMLAATPKIQNPPLYTTAPALLLTNRFVGRNYLSWSFDNGPPIPVMDRPNYHGVVV